MRKKQTLVFLRQMTHEIHDLNQMVLLFYRCPDPRMRTSVQFEEFVEQNT